VKVPAHPLAPSNLHVASCACLLQAAKGQNLGPALVDIIRGTLPHLAAFKVGYHLAINAPSLTCTPTGVRTLELLTGVQVRGVCGTVLLAVVVVVMPLGQSCAMPCRAVLC
jgi:hypothetical protein